MATLNEAGKLYKTSSRKKRKRDYAAKTSQLEVLPKITPSAKISAIDVPVAPQIHAPHTFEMEVGKDLEQTGEDVSAPANMGEGSSHGAGPSFLDPMEAAQDLSFRTDKGKENVFVIEPRLPGQDRPMTVEDSALRKPEVAYALATSLSSPKD